MSSLTRIVLKIPGSKALNTHKRPHTHMHSLPHSAHYFPTGAGGDQVATLFLLSPSSTPSCLFLSQINASESGFKDIFDVCVCVRESRRRKGWGALITSQGTLISDGNIWFTLSWRDSCIKSRNYPNQFKLHPPPSLLHAAPLCI